MSFAQRTNQFFVNNWSSGNTIVTSFPGGTVPITGNLLVAGIASAFNITVVSVVDGNGNALTKTPNSPSSVNDATSGSAWIYWFVVPSNPHQTYTATLSTPIFNGALWIREITVTGNPPQLEMDAAGNGSGTVENSPIATAANAGNFLYAVGHPEGTTTGVGGSWVTGSLSGTTGGRDAYIESSLAGSTPINITQTDGQWDAMVASFNQSIPSFGVQRTLVGVGT